MCGVLALLLLGSLGIGATSVVADGEAQPFPVPEIVGCRPTLANGMTPPSEEPSPFHHGNGRLYSALWPDSVILADPRLVEPDGSIRMKSPWWRAPGVGAAGDLVITGHELSSGATITASIPDGYVQRFQATGIFSRPRAATRSPAGPGPTHSRSSSRS